MRDVVSHYEREQWSRVLDKAALVLALEQGPLTLAGLVQSTGRQADSAPSRRGAGHHRLRADLVGPFCAGASNDRAGGGGRRGRLLATAGPFSRAANITGESAQLFAGKATCV